MTDQADTLNELTKGKGPWYSLTGEGVSRILKTSVDTGLSEPKLKNVWLSLGLSQ